MEGFWKPGSAPPGVDDRDLGSEGGHTVVWNPNETLSVQKQRLSLPVYQHRAELLFCVQKFRVTIVVGATGLFYVLMFHEDTSNCLLLIKRKK
jgi:ATP-dependent RNA helicase DDX35